MRRIKQILGLALIACVCIASTVTVQARLGQKTVVRVGFPIQQGISYLDENGNYAGYMVDYLEQLSLYTNWDYEYVMVDGDLNTQIVTLMEMMLNGEIDMMGTMNRSPELEQMFLYPSYSYGTTYTALTVREDSLWVEDDFSNWNGIRIAASEEQTQRMDQLAQFAQLNDFTYETIPYHSMTEAIEAVQSGEADATLQVDIAILDNFRSIARFSPTPYYFALNQENHQLLQTLNTALYSMNRAYPHLQTELYDEYFYSYGNFMLSEDDKRHIAQMGTLKVAFCDGNAPLQYVKDGKVGGMAATFFEEFSEATGLQYEPVIVDSCAHGIELIEAGEVDIIACAASTSSYIAVDGIQFSLPYFSGSSLLVSSPTATDPANYDTQRFYTNTQKSLNSLRKGDMGYARLDAYSVNYYMQKKVLYDELKVDWSSSKNVSYCVGVTSRVSSELLSVFNHYISALSDVQSQSMFYRAMAEKVEYTFGEWLYVYKVYLIGAAIVLGLAICLYQLYRYSRKARREMALTQQQLEQLSRYDALTGAYNGGEFRTLLGVACSRKIPMVLVALNLRNFKYINETYGLSTADKFLRGIKRCLDSIQQPGEFFCRQSADVFYIALRETEAEKAMERIETLQHRIQQTATTLLGQYPVSIYCGIVLTAAAPEPFSASAKHNYMMAALAQAKKCQKENVYIYDQELHKLEQTRLYAESNMKRALEQEEFQLYLQPKIDLSTGLLTGAEALVRWQTKDRGMLFPDQFIPLFEENGFCVHLDLYMVEQACKQLRRWMDEGMAPTNISVNQTRLLFASEGYVSKLLAITEKYGISPQCITLEILESLVLDHVEHINACIEELRSAGFRISMDDFGSGYSSLNILGRLKIDELKLDRLFLMGAAKDTDGSQRKIMACILELAKQLHISTVAEGVETQENEQMMVQLCCNYGQGYYYSRPLTIADFEREFLAPYSRHVQAGVH